MRSFSQSPGISKAAGSTSVEVFLSKNTQLLICTSACENVCRPISLCDEELVILSKLSKLVYFIVIGQSWHSVVRYLFLRNAQFMSIYSLI